MKRSCCVWLVTLFALGITNPWAVCAADESVQQQIEELDSDDSEVRDAAEQKLLDAGPEALGPLGRAAINGSLEQRFRSVRVLAQLLRSDDDQVVQEPAKRSRRSPPKTSGP